MEGITDGCNSVVVVVFFSLLLVVEKGQGFLDQRPCVVEGSALAPGRSSSLFMLLCLPQSGSCPFFVRPFFTGYCHFSFFVLHGLCLGVNGGNSDW